MNDATKELLDALRRIASIEEPGDIIAYRIVKL